MSYDRLCVVYLTWGETPRSYGVFGNQVIEQFRRISNYSKGEFHFVSGVPLLHSGMVREKWNYNNEVKAVRKKLGSVVFSRIPIFSPQTFVNSSQKMFPFFHGISHFFLAKKLRKIKPEVVHCRSYHAAWAALKVREKYCLNYKIIFDGRDMWPEEVALKNGYNQESLDYLFLKSIEKELLSKCDLSIGVSDEMSDYYIRLGAKKAKCVYLSADTDVFSSNYCRARFEQDVIKFCYVGALDESGWHKISELCKLYRKLRTLFSKTHLTIISTSSHKNIQTVFDEFPHSEITITASKSREELADILSTQHIGLMAYFSPKDYLQLSLGKILLAIKTVEYLSAGLPMICNQFCGGAARLLQEEGMGIIYSPDDINIDRVDIENLIDNNVAHRCINFANKHFNVDSNAVNYLNLYKDLLVK